MTPLARSVAVSLCVQMKQKQYYIQYMYILLLCLDVFLAFEQTATQPHNNNITWLLYPKINIMAEHLHATVVLKERCQLHNSELLSWVTNLCFNKTVCIVRARCLQNKQLLLLERDCVVYNVCGTHISAEVADLKKKKNYNNFEYITCTL